MVAVLILLGIYTISQMTETLIQDEFMLRTAQPADNSKVTLVLIDDQSLHMLRGRFGQPPWPRSAYVEMFTKLQQHDPAAIVFDSVFSSLDPDMDGPVIEEMKKVDNLVMGHAVDYGESAIIKVPGFYHLNLGVVNTQKDLDGVVRTIQPIFQQLVYSEKKGVQGIFPSLSLAAVLQLLEHESIIQKTPGQEWMVSVVKEQEENFLTITPNGDIDRGKKLPLDDKGNFRLRWYQLSPGGGGVYNLSHYSIPVCRLFDSCQAPMTSLSPQDIAQIKDHIVVIGASATVYRDFSATPMSQSHLGADIHATAMDNIHRGETLKNIPKWQNWILLILFCIPIFYLRLKLQSLGPTFLYTIALMIVFFWIAQEEFRQGLILDVITPEVFMVVAFAAGTFLKEYTKDRQVQALEKNLSQLVSKAVFNEIQKMEYVIKAGGQRKDITSMFVDLRNFTTLSEHLSPTEVTDILNEFYTAVEKIIQQGDTAIIDKFMGDGILIMFGAPRHSDTHADDALAAARKIIDITDELIAKWDQEKNITKTIGVPLNVGISMSTGNVFVGFLGTPTRLEYSAVGDTVNLCVRLQEQTKVFRTRLILSEYTAKLLSEAEQLRLYPLDEIRVRGREMPLRIFTFEEYRNQHMEEKVFEPIGQTKTLPPAENPPPAS